MKLVIGYRQGFYMNIVSNECRIVNVFFEYNKYVLAHLNLISGTRLHYYSEYGIFRINISEDSELIDHLKLIDIFDYKLDDFKNGIFELNEYGKLLLL